VEQVQCGYNIMVQFSSFAVQ